jgi:hypothetical protein
MTADVPETPPGPYKAGQLMAFVGPSGEPYARHITADEAGRLNAAWRARQAQGEEQDGK